MSFRRLLTLGAVALLASGFAPVTADAAECAPPTATTDGRVYGSCNSAALGAGYVLDGAIPSWEPGVPPIVESTLDKLFPTWLVDEPTQVDTLLSQGPRDVAPSCGFKATATSGGQVLLRVEGVAMATGRGRATVTELTCEVYRAVGDNPLGTKVYGLTRSESGAVAPLTGSVFVPDGSFTLCTWGRAKYDDGEWTPPKPEEGKAYPKTCVSPS